MTALLPANEPRQLAPEPSPANSLETLATLLIVVITVAILYFAREILVPIAIAILLSFALSPLVKGLRRIGIGKTLAVVMVVVSGFLVAVGLGAILAKQISDLAEDAPRYQVTVAAKAGRFKDFAANNVLLHHLESAIEDVSRLAPAAPPPPKQEPVKPDPSKSEPAKPGSSKPADAGKPADDGKPGVDALRGGDAKAPAPVPVEIVSPAPGVLTILQTVAGTAASPVATAAFVAIFVIFILMQREDLRNRFIRLVGRGDLHRTTLAMTDAGKRLSRYLLAQVLLNTGFGVFVAAALTLLGVPSALLWGMVAAVMRFIPYVGSFGAALGPIVMATVAGDGWSLAVETALLFVVAELIVGQVIEPLVYGRHTGISPIAIVASATFWTWLWGPVGLVLSTPLTVCLVVMGRHVDRLAFLDVLLGDAPALSPVESFYQRMLAGDPSEVVDHADKFLRENSLVAYCDQVAMRALLMAQVDVRRGVLEDKRQTRIRDTMRDLVEDLVDDERRAGQVPGADGEVPAALEGDSEAARASAADEPPAPDIDPAWREGKAVVCVAGRTPLDEAAAHLLADLLARQGIGVHVESAESLVAQDVAALAAPETRLVLLSFLDADLRLAQARFAVRRLRRRVPDVPIAAAFWMAEEDEARATGLCSDVRADICVSSLPQAIDLCLERATAAPVATADAA